MKRGALSIKSASVQRLTLLLRLLLVASVFRLALLAGLLALLSFLLALAAIIVALAIWIVHVCLLAAISGVLSLVFVAGIVGHDGFPLLLFRSAQNEPSPGAH
ncbi:MAG: hypothetical protein EON93_24360 [Burkholderiales bacterium]|nr:MAG: hypothetical protein EON93_24360 [Burkholderiales bacterium]